MSLRLRLGESISLEVLLWKDIESRSGLAALSALECKVLLLLRILAVRRMLLPSTTFFSVL